MLGEHVAAAADYTRAIALIREPEKPRPAYYIDRARVLVAAGDEHVDTAIRGLEQGMLRLGPIITIELCALDIEVGRKRYDAALERLEGLASRAARPARWWARRGDIFEAAGRNAEARDAYLRALKEMEATPEHRRRTRQALKLRTDVHEALHRLEPVAKAAQAQSEAVR